MPVCNALPSTIRTLAAGSFYGCAYFAVIMCEIMCFAARPVAGMIKIPHSFFLILEWQGLPLGAPVLAGALCKLAKG